MFTAYVLKEDRDEVEVEKVMGLAIREAGDPTKHDVLMEDEKDYTWEYGANVLNVTPEKGDNERPVAMTWGIFADAWTGINNFRQAYPGLYFIYRINVFTEKELSLKSMYHLGIGRLAFI